jgi:hypothetical protein
MEMVSADLMLKGSYFSLVGVLQLNTRSVLLADCLSVNGVAMIIHIPRCLGSLITSLRCSHS